MGVEFASGRLSGEAMKHRAAATTAEQLAALTNDPAFHEWQAKKARRENNARSVTNLLAVAACVALAVTMALLKPAATAPAPPAPAAAPAVVDPVALLAADLTSEAATYAVAFGFYGAEVTPLDGAAAVDSVPTPATAAAAGAVSLSPEEVQQVLEMAQYRMYAAQAEAEAAEDAAADLTLRLTAAEAERELVASRLAELEAASAAKEADARFSEVAAAELLAHVTAQLEDMRQEVVAAEAAAAAAASLAEATAAAAAALLEAPPGEHFPAPAGAAMHASMASEVMMAELEAAQVLPQQLTIPFSAAVPSDLDSWFNASWAPPTAVAPPPAATSMSLAVCTAGAAFAAAALAAALLHLRSRRRLAAEAARASALSARLKEAAFAKDTAEQSLGLLERELQRRMKQLEDAQQAAADAASPKIGTTFAPSAEGSLLHTPGRGELPPPPASLVEKFLRDHNFLAVQHEQMTEWLEMEQQYGEMQAALEELQGALADKDAQIAAYEHDLSSVNEHTHVELRSCEDQLAQVRAWLDEAQEELLETQAALQEREAECRLVGSQLVAMQTVAVGAQESATSLEGRDSELQRQNLELVGQLQSVTGAYEAMRMQLAAASASGEALALGAFGSNTARPASAASAVPGTPADLSREVQSCLEMMRATRAQLADRLAHSQGVCEAMIADCQVAQGGLVGAFTAAADSSDGEEQEGEASPAASPAYEPAPFGSPAAVTPLPGGVETNPLFEAEGWEGEEELSSTPAAGAAAAEEEECSVLGSSRRFNTSLQATPSPAHSKSPPGSDCTPGASDGSMRSAWQSAHSRVAEARAMHSGWDLAGFVRSLGFQVANDKEDEGEASSAPMDRAAFEALRASAEEALGVAAAAAETSPERALAGQAMQVVREWEFPVQRINTPPPSPFWRLLGLQS